MIRITYQKRNGEIIDRDISGMCLHKIGEETSMGWKVIDIKHMYKGKYYPSHEYDNLINRDWNRIKMFSSLKRRFKSLYTDTTFLLFLFILLKEIRYVIYNFM